jgi:glycosyltransferase involved in cell wall biosynthesis
MEPAPLVSSPRPNVLILSDEGPQTGTAGGLLLHRLFRRWPAERLRVLARHVPPAGERLPDVTYHSLRPPWFRFEGSRFNRLKRSLRACGLVPSVSVHSVDALLDGFQPNVVFCVMQHAQYYDAALHFSRQRGLPLVAAVHDVNDEFEPVYAWARGGAQRRDGDFYRTARRRLCISPEMESLCATRFGVAGDVLYPNRGEDLAPRPFAEADRLRQPGRLTVGFAGNLYYGYGAALSQLLPAIRAAGIKLVVYGRPPAAELAALAAATDCCEFRGFVPAADAWNGIQRDCDAVWLPYPDPAGAMEALYRHHFPSKLPEYLALGLPVIVTGPDYATGLRWARANPTAVASTAGADHTAFTALLRDLTVNPARRRQLAESGWAAGQRDFDPVAICTRFRDHLAAAAASS